MPFPVAAAVAAGASLLSSGGQIMAQGKMNRATRQWNEAMYGRQREDAINDWRIQNEYNSPAAQMARYKAAGLNPNLIYGQSNEGATVRSTPMESWRPETPNIAGLSRAAVEGISAYQDWTLQQEQVKNMAATRRNMELDSLLKGVDLAYKQVQTASKGLEYKLALENYDTLSAQMKEELRAMTTGTDIRISQEARNAALHSPTLERAMLDVANKAADTQLKKQQIENLKKAGVLQSLEIGLRNKGMSYSDPLVLRMISQFADGKSLPDAVRELIRNLDSDGTNDAPTGKGAYPVEERIKFPRFWKKR